MGFPIRKSLDQSSFAAPQGLSQRTTSFIASQRQGIHRMLLRHLIASMIDVRFFWDLASSQISKQTSRSKKQKDRFPDPFRSKNLMLAEHNRTGPALAANPATFPLNDVSHLPSRTVQMTSPSGKTRVFPDAVQQALSRLDPTWGNENGGAGRDRTDDLMLAKQLLSQLSYSPKPCGIGAGENKAKPRKADKAARADARSPSRRTSTPAPEAASKDGGPGTTRTSDLTLIRGAL